MQGLGFGLELMKRNTENVSPALKRGGLQERGSRDSCPHVCVSGMSALHPHLLPWITLRSETLKVVMALEI